MVIGRGHIANNGTHNSKLGEFLNVLFCFGVGVNRVHILGYGEFACAQSKIPCCKPTMNFYSLIASFLLD